jgi:hypothetical protein
VVAHFPMHDQVLQHMLPRLLVLHLGRCPLRLINGLRDGMILLDNPMHVLLEASHLADDILDDLGWQLFKDLVLSSAQDEGGDPLLEGLEGLEEALGLLQLL